MRYKEIIYRRLFIYNFVWGHRGEGPGSLLYGEVTRDRRPLKREKSRNCIGGIRHPRNGPGGFREKPINKGLSTIK